MSNPMLLFAEDGYIPVQKWEHEDLTRDSEKLHCIESLAANPNILFDRDMVLAICGRAHEKDNNEEVK